MPDPDKPPQQPAPTFASAPFFNWQTSGINPASMNQLSPHLREFQGWVIQSYGGSSAGGHVDRPVRGGTAPSSHGYGAAFDWNYGNDTGAANALMQQVISNPDRFGIQAIHDYNNMRVWRAGRGWQSQPQGSHGGQMRPGTHHLHFETSQQNYNRTGWNFQSIPRQPNLSSPPGNISGAGSGDSQLGGNKPPGAGVGGGLPGGPMPPPDPSIAWLQQQVGAGNAYLNNQIGGLGAQLNQSAAFTQMQQQAMERQAALDRQLLQNRAAGVGLNQQSAEAQQQYRVFLGQFQNQLIDIERAAAEGNLSGAQATFAELGRSSARLQELAAQGRTNTIEYLQASQQLDQDIHAQAMRWLGEQGAFNERDLALTQQAITDLLTTEGARFAELGRASGAEQRQAGRRRGIRLREVDLQRGAQERALASDATARGAMGARGTGDNLRLIRDMAALGIDQSRTQFDSDMEGITQAFNQGQISWDDAQRQAVGARGRAQLTFEQNTGALANQREQAGHTLRGANLATGNARNQAELQYQQQMESIANALNNGQISFDAAQRRFNELRLQQEAERNRVAQEQEMQRRVYELQQQQYQLDRDAYGVQDKNRQAELDRQRNELAYAHSQAVAQLNAQRMGYEAQRPQIFAPGGGGTPMVGGFGGGGGGGGGNKPPSMSAPAPSRQSAQSMQQNKPPSSTPARSTRRVGGSQLAV